MLLILKNKTIFVYNANGTIIYVNTEEVKINGQIAEKAQEKKFIWDEENRLGAVDINGYVSNYTYDAGGERVTKLSGGGQCIFVNSVFSGGKTSTSDFTLYVNPYLVAQNGGRYTKHIYIGSQRIVSKLGDFDSYGADPRRVEKAGESFSGVKVNYDAKYKKSLEVVKANYDTFEVPYYGNDNNDYVNGLGFCCNPSGETSSSSSGTSGSTTGKLMAGKNDNAELQQFYYHPDHLRSSSYISNLDGEVVQHVEYVPFGEVFLEEKNSKWNTPYLFTSKELDKETGLYYFGARYQDPKLGVFISVDPMAEEVPEYSPYSYTFNNPINFTDPDGNWPVPRFTIAGFGYSMNRLSELCRRKIEGESWSSAYYNTYRNDVKNVIRYATPIEDVYGAYAGKDFDGEDYNRAAAGAWAVVAIVPFGKAAKLLKYSDEAADIIKVSGRVLDNTGKEGKEIVTILKEGHRTAENGAKVAKELIGDLGSDAVQKLGKFGGQKDKVVGFMSKDGKKGWRVDWDIKKGGHINWWNGNQKGAVLINAGENQIDQIIKNEIAKKL